MIKKYIPYFNDIEPKLKNKEVERDNTKFEMTNLIYNPIYFSQAR
jgi:hypothetical protein